MKRFILTYNTIFLLAANLLAANLHYSHNHVEPTIDYKCKECLLLETNSSCDLGFQNNHFFNNSNIELLLIQLNPSEFKFCKKYHSRAPPFF